MNKEDILKRFLEEEKNEVSNLYDKMILSVNKDIPMFGNSFYPPNIWKFFEKQSDFFNIEIKSYGAFKEAERRMIAFNNIYDLEYPLRVLKIENGSKFNELSHRNYLGSILSLGIKREKIGDLILKDNKCYLSVSEDIKDFLIMNLKKIGNTPCIITEVEENLESISHNIKEENILISSMRLDSIVAKLTRKSRGTAQEMINNGLVLVNYNTNRDKSFEISKEDRLTIRKYGKFIIGDSTGHSKSGKVKINIKKYT